MSTWISVPLQIEEKEALHRLAEIEKRNSRLQAALIIRNELERRGLIKPERIIANTTLLEGCNGR